MMNKKSFTPAQVTQQPQTGQVSKERVSYVELFKELGELMPVGANCKCVCEHLLKDPCELNCPEHSKNTTPSVTNVGDIEKTLYETGEGGEKEESWYKGYDAAREYFLPKLSQLQQTIQELKAENERLVNMYGVSKECEEITGFATGAEWAAYQKGQEGYDDSVCQFVKEWNGEINSHLGQALADKFKDQGERLISLAKENKEQQEEIERLRGALETLKKWAFKTFCYNAWKGSDTSLSYYEYQAEKESEFAALQSNQPLT